jgi:carboxypeptidase PM20D1
MRSTVARLVVGIVTLLPISVAVGRALHAPTDTRQALPAAIPVPVSAGAGERLAGALRLRTISTEDPATFDADAFSQLHAYLQSAFPLVHAHLSREAVGSHSLLYRWPGTDPALAPILIAGHLDVVPVEPGTEHTWQVDPFGGRIVDGFIWGRGAIDNKSTVLGTLEAVEMLLRDGFRPERTVYLAYGHDEEVGGTRGARAIAGLLAARGVALEMVVDEGGVIGDGILPGIDDPVALVGIAEKGFVTIELSVRMTGGHSSLPPRQTAVGVLGAAVARLETGQMPARLDGPTRQMFERVAPRLPLLQRTLFAHEWMTRPLILRTLERSPTTNAMVRTTTASTVFQAGSKDNVLPSYARTLVNVRILPGDSIAAVVEHVARVVDDRRVAVAVAGRFSAEPSAVSDTTSTSYRTLQRTIRSVVPDVVVAPYLVVVATDARYYSGLTRNVFRFVPLRLTGRDLERMHGIDERIGVDAYHQAIRIYRQLLLDATRG